jgi:hypothetical protein
MKDALDPHNILANAVSLNDTFRRGITIDAGEQVQQNNIDKGEVADLKTVLTPWPRRW